MLVQTDNMGNCILFAENFLTRYLAIERLWREIRKNKKRLGMIFLGFFVGDED